MKKTLLVLVVLLGIAWLLYTPDADPVKLEQRYANPPSTFLQLEGGARLHYRLQGQADKPTLVLVHGTSASLHTWEPLVNRLQAEFGLLSLDLLGHGLTGATTQRTYTHDAQIAAINDLLGHLQIDNATLIGNSFGGSIAWQFALTHPERVKALVLIAPSGVPKREQSDSNIGFKLLSTSFAQSLMTKVTPRWILERSLKQTIVDDELVTQDMVDRYWMLLRKPGNRQAMVDMVRSRKPNQRWENLDAITAPALLIWGEEDAILPVSMSETFVQRMPNLQYEKMSDIGHIPMEEAPDLVAQHILTFCDQHDC